MKKIIITADDYGMCSIVDKAIDDCASAGLLTSTNVLVNQDDLEAAKTFRSRFPNVSVGMHWNVTDGKPVCRINEVCSLIDPQTNEFWGVSTFIKKFKSGEISKEELRKELLMQYEIFKKLCGDADYWNVHMNSSLDFKTFPFFNSLALELGLTKTRNFQRVYISPSGIPGGIKGKLIEYAKKKVFDYWFGSIIRKTGTKMPDGRMMYFNSEDKTSNIDNIGKNVQWKKNEIVELVIHPSISSEYHNFGTLKEVRVSEWKMFSSPSTLEYLKTQGIELVNFEAIE